MARASGLFDISSITSPTAKPCCSTAFDECSASRVRLGRYYDEKGHLELVHRVTGVRTLEDEFDKVASHNEHHLSQIRSALQD
jgi:hypothetical protein